MPGKLIEAKDLTVSSHPHEQLKQLLQLPHESWLPILQHPCDFDPTVFESVSLNLLKNPNINSSLLFRADILYDSKDDEATDDSLSREEKRQALEAYKILDGGFHGFELGRTLLRRMIPRNPQLDKPMLQTCVFLKSTPASHAERTLVVYIPHASSIDEIPWYHPRVQALAYMHDWSHSTQKDRSGSVSLHFRLYSFETLPLSSRLQRTAQHLLSTVHKHGQGLLAGYQKQVNHDQIISQQRVQDKYSELKKTHAKRLCDNWVEQTEPSKHVFEDLGIAAFLIELWKDTYTSDDDWLKIDDHASKSQKPVFPGFVDIGCGNGVLVDILIREGYSGWGFDARKRKTWATFDSRIRKNLKELILVPKPFTHNSPQMRPADQADGHQASHRWSISSALKHCKSADTPAYHDGIFPIGTFIISNHADELTPWTPLLASLSSSPFLCIPCCSHNLSGQRFRAPSVFNGNSADGLAPLYFADQVKRGKGVPIVTAHTDNEEMYAPNQAAEQGDLKALKASERKKQPSAYASLCDWVTELSMRVGYDVEKEMLRLPSTRNLGIVGRHPREGFKGLTLEAKMERVIQIVKEEKADGKVWMDRAHGLVKGQGPMH
ncbi:uncharacterized protein KY384_006358 [Bacidia gigantensis]|uniref:uncharacterized protein n=1 Tax=Bacidia gigantensis TaxID=2732470 RepID=UPI001D04FAA4|nr:uncharacterized protein KY384_006358 [Bacidia gigantensis]KAG8528671.1 hypothetical protein KY384_006358 [Bacidia gigantensis]